ncbi:cytochrome P450 [Novosphingobium fuchskuhlense]|uniref:cytochrome P450 n=1 Tax=Novosphingobium fuchskuhlense TaxID=1117702 RepID=UPI001F0B1729|nr:cytochrome P450 [Novosphingobium fuchskuhlense]
MASLAAPPTRAVRPHDAQSERGNPHWTRLKDERELDHIPGSDGWPIVGTTFQLLADPIGYGNRMRAAYGDVYRTRSFGRRQVTLIGPEANELVLFDRDKIFSSEQGWGPVLNLLFPRGLMLMDFAAHRADRRALSIAFKPEPMRHYCDALNADIARGVEAWGAGERKFYSAIKALTLETAATSFLGLPLGPEADRLNKAFVDMVQASVAPVRRPLPFTAMGKGYAGRKLMVDYFTRLVRERRAKPGQDMFSQFAMARRDDDPAADLLPEDVVVDHMIFLMMAAHDTITSSFTTLIWHLAKNPEWQEKLRAEARAAAGGDGVPLAYDALGKMELAEMAMKEALRIMPPVPSTPRRAMRDFTFGGYRIPAGTNVGVSAAAVHADPALWPDPERFDPLRFTPAAVAARHKYAWIPYGGGAHMCLGLHFATMQTKLLVHHILTRYQVEAEPGYTPAWQAWPIPKPRDGLQVRLVRL